jgi:crotonobetainyl-CoA:carnitine CoA-transferase CaiB-like acyl-CoA transferase
MAITAALYAGRGERIEISLFSATIASLINVAQNALVTGKEANRYGNQHASIVPYQVFHAKDRPFAVGAGTDRHYEALCREVIERPDLLRFATNTERVERRRELVPALEQVFRSREAKHWVDRCRAAKVPAAVVQGVREALQSPAGQKLIVNVPYDAVLNPLVLGGRRLPIRTTPPALGQHTDAVLRELGISATRGKGRRTRRG